MMRLTGPCFRIFSVRAVDRDRRRDLNGRFGSTWAMMLAGGRGAGLRRCRAGIKEKRVRLGSTRMADDIMTDRAPALIQASTHSFLCVSEEKSSRMSSIVCGVGRSRRRVDLRG